MKNIIVTGASSGLGLELVKLLLSEKLYLISRTKPNIQLKKQHIWIPCDISSKKRVVSISSKLPDRIDVLFHCAGVGLSKDFLHWSFEEIDKVIGTNLLGTIYFCRKVYEKMVKFKKGQIIIVVSTSGKKPRENETVYCASKFGQAGFSESLRLEAMKHNVRVTTVYPGGMKTNFYKNQPGKSVDHFMDPKAVAKQIIHLLGISKNSNVSQISIERMS